MKNDIKPCVVGNWKMHGNSAMISDFAAAFVKRLSSQAQLLSDLDIVICPPALYLAQLKNNLNPSFLTEFSLKWGLQNLYYEPAGAFTGEISPQMAAEAGCQYVITGHSERRRLFFEDDALIARKFAAAYHAGLIPILCVGETAAEQADGKGHEAVRRQLKAVLEHLPVTVWSEAIIAYEPIWAIGTGTAASPKHAETMHAFIRQSLAEQDKDAAAKARILYGGSVNSENAAGLMHQPNINGFLLGGASLTAETFLQICEKVVLQKVID